MSPQPHSCMKWYTAYQSQIQHLNFHQIPCIIIDSSDEQNEWYMLSENLQRDDLTDSEKGEAIEKIRTAYDGNISNVKLSDKLGVTEGAIRLWRNAAGYPEEVKQMTKNREVTDYSVRPIVSLSTPQEQIKVAEHIRRFNPRILESCRNII